MLDILAIKADVYQLERQGKRLPVYRYLREVWQKELPSEGLTVLALQQMVDYVEYVDDYPKIKLLERCFAFASQSSHWVLFA